MPPNKNAIISVFIKKIPPFIDENHLGKRISEASEFALERIKRDYCENAKIISHDLTRYDSDLLLSIMIEYIS